MFACFGGMRLLASDDGNTVFPSHSSRLSRDSLSFRVCIEWHLNIRSVRLGASDIHFSRETRRVTELSIRAVAFRHRLSCLRRKASLRATRQTDGECNEHVKEWGVRGGRDKEREEGRKIDGWNFREKRHDYFE